MDKENISQPFIHSSSSSYIVKTTSKRQRNQNFQPATFVYELRNCKKKKINVNYKNRTQILRLIYCTYLLYSIDMQFESFK